MNAHITGAELKNANAPKTIVLGGKEYEVALDMNAICDLEERYGSFENAAKTLDDIGQDFSKPDVMKNIRFILCVMLRHTDESMTEKQAGRLMTMQDMQHIMDSLGEAMGASVPETDEKNASSPQEA